MIKTFFCDINDEIYNSVNEYVNKNLEAMINCYINLAVNDKEWWTNIFPALKYEENNDFGIKTIKELHNLISSKIVRETIKPKYEYALMHIINFWIDLECDGEGFEFIDIDNNLKEKIDLYDSEYEEDEEYYPLIKAIKSINNYEELCFWDWDFEPNIVDELTNSYIKRVDSRKCNEKYHHLDDYQELMSPDLKERYLEVRKIGGEEILYKNENVEQAVIKKIYSSLRRLEERVSEIYSDNEVKISNRICDMNEADFNNDLNLQIEREKLIGRAISTLGEADFYIYKNTDYYKNIAIIENKELDKTKDSFYECYNQVQGYLNQNFEFAATISINRKRRIDESIEYILKCLEEYKNTEVIIKKIELQPFGDDFRYLIRSICSIPEDNTRTLNIYHLILNLNDKNRIKLAEVAREKKKRNKRQ